MKLATNDEAVLKAWAKELHGTIRVTLFANPDSRSLEMKGFCEELHRLVPPVQVEQSKAEAGLGPAIGITENIRYEAVPAGRELPPFLDILQAAAHGVKTLSPTEREALSRVDAPTTVRIYVTPECPFCPGTVARLLPLALECPLLHMTVIDAMLFPEKASADGVRAAPSVILDDRIRWAGTIDMEEFIKAAVSRDPSQLSVDTLQTLLGEGGAEDLAAMMAAGGSVFPGFLDLLTHEKWPIRLGAMVAFEYLREKDEELSERVLESLWIRFCRCSDTVKGDILHLLGETGAKTQTARLKALLEGSETEEVRTAAAEALAALSEDPA